MFFANRLPGLLRFTALFLVACVLLPMLSPISASAYRPPRTTLRIGLNWGNTAVASTNLQNEAGAGSGFEFGYYDTSHNFTPVATTAETRISVMIDHNMQWNPGGAFSGQYESRGVGMPAAGSIAVGYIHWRINSGRTTLAAALTDISGISDGFIRYSADSGGGNFIPMYGNYTSDAVANAARRSTAHTRDVGTARTITVSRTGSNLVLFEFDNSANTSRMFGIRPINHARPSTHNRGERYFGGFRFERRVPEAMTVVNIVNIEDYVQGVIPYEMSNTWPLEALKAQAICARTYAMRTLNKHSAHGFDLCTEMDCQVYRGRRAANATTDRAVNETTGMYVTHNGVLAETLYVSSHGGGSENNENIWAGTPRPYLRGVLDNYEDRVAHRISNYNWTHTLSQATVTQRVRNAGHPNASNIVSMHVSLYSATGNVVSVNMTDANGRNYTFSRRAGLQAAFGAIRSQRFNIGSVTWQQGGSVFANAPAQSISTSQYQVISGSADGTVSTSTVTGALVAIDGSGTGGTHRDVIAVGGGSRPISGAPTGPVNGNFILTGRGWGHSLGMSQWGAFSQAELGRTAEQIIRHYYTGVQVTRAT